MIKINEHKGADGKVYKKVYFNDVPLLSANTLLKPLKNLLYGNKDIPKRVLEMASIKGQEVENGVNMYLKTNNIGRSIGQSYNHSTQMIIKYTAFFMKYRKKWEMISHNEMVYNNKFMAYLDFVIKDEQLGIINVETKTNNNNPLTEILFGIQCYIQTLITGRPTWLLWTQKVKESSKPKIIFKQVSNHPIIKDIFKYLINMHQDKSLGEEDLRNFLKELDIAYDNELTKNHQGAILWENQQEQT